MSNKRQNLKEIHKFFTVQAGRKGVYYKYSEESRYILEQFDQGGSGDYTAEKYLNDEPEPTDEEIRKMFGL